MTVTKRTTRRIIGLDIARAFAIVGMVIVNFNVVMASSVSEPAWLKFFARSLEGRAAATFVVLAGIGASLGSKHAREEGTSEQRDLAKRILLKRALFLFAIGWLFFPIWPADILHYYGVYLAIGATLLFAPTKTLLRVGLAAAVVSFTFILSADFFANWDMDELSYTGIATPVGFIRNLFFDGLHPVLPWIVFYLFGMWLGRLDLNDQALRRRFTRVSVVAVLVVETIAWFVVGAKGTDHDHLADDAWQWLFSVEMLPPMPLYLVAGAGTAWLVIAGSIWLGNQLSERESTPLVHTGQLALTLYVAHVIVGLGVLEAMGRMEDQTLPFIIGASLVFSAVSVVYATLWRRRYRRGPLEWVMRRMSG